MPQASVVLFLHVGRRLSIKCQRYRRGANKLEEMKKIKINLVCRFRLKWNELKCRFIDARSKCSLIVWS